MKMDGVRAAEERSRKEEELRGERKRRAELRIKRKRKRKNKRKLGIRRGLDEGRKGGEGTI